MSPALRIAIVAVAVATLTWTLGWWAVAPVALVAGLLPRRWRLGGGAMAVAAALAWGAWLAWQASHGQFGTLLDRVGGVLQLPAAALLVVAVLFPALLGWAGATVGAAIATLLTRPQQDARPDARQISNEREKGDERHPDRATA